MKVNVDGSRILHLLLLIGCSAAFGSLLVKYLEWNPMAAHSVACAVVTQVSNVLMQQFEDPVDAGGDSSAVADKKIKTGGNPKKRKKVKTKGT